jgi:argininosuccinate lyase
VKLWAGRFNKGTAKEVDDFHSSIEFDCRMYKQDIRASQAHAEMLGRQGIIPEEEARLIMETLSEIEQDLEAGKCELSKDTEDIHMNVESILISRIGAVGGKLHTARSRNDQVATDVRLYLKDEAQEIDLMLIRLEKALIDVAEKQKQTVLPGYTHLQRAQPVLLPHHLLAYVEMLQRDRGRLFDCIKRADELPLGSGALAGVAYPVDRDWVAKKLGFAGVSHNSMDAVADRDFICEFIGFAAIVMMHISRLCEEIILWSSQEFGFIELDDAYATGSSIMPQKKNPDVAELARGKTGRVYGHLMGILTVMKGLPLAYNKDMQEDKEALFDTIDTLKMTLKVLAPMIETMQVKQNKMFQATEKGFLNATDLADYLVTKGVPFRTAHSLAGQAVKYCLEKDCTLGELPFEYYRQLEPKVSRDIYDALDIKNCLEKRNSVGGTGNRAVEDGLYRAKTFLKPFWPN